MKKQQVIKFHDDYHRANNKKKENLIIIYISYTEKKIEFYTE